MATIAAGYYATCGIAGDGRTFCWGANDHGQLGNGHTAGVEPIPAPVSGALEFTQVVVGGFVSVSADLGAVNPSFACGLTGPGAAYCWGSNALGQLGTGVASNTPQPSPVAVTGDHKFVSLAGNGFATACGLVAGGSAYCWGSNTYGELGIGSVGGFSYAPVRAASTLTFVMFESGASTCGSTASGETYCWGSLSYAQDRGKPALVASIPFASIATGAAYCWGSDDSAKLGRG